MKKSHSLTLYKRLAVILFIILVIFTAAVIVLLRTPDARYRHNVNLGSRYMHNQEYDEAVRVFTKAIEIDPRRSEAYEKRGEAYMDLGRPEQAYDDYKRVEDLTGEKGLAERKTGISDPSQAGASGTETPKPVPSGADPAGNSGPRERSLPVNLLQVRLQHLLRRSCRPRNRPLKRQGRSRRIITVSFRMCAMIRMATLFRAMMGTRSPIILHLR